MSARKDEPSVMQAYRLGAVASALFLEKPEGWQRKIKANIRKARKLGVKVSSELSAMCWKGGPADETD